MLLTNAETKVRSAPADDTDSDMDAPHDPATPVSNRRPGRDKTKAVLKRQLQIVPWCLSRREGLRLALFALLTFRLMLFANP